mgnify:CR=1 FL=1
MSQERTEQPKSAPEAVSRIVDAQGEIDRLNAVIKELQDGLKEIAKPYGDVSSPPALERRLLALKLLEKSGVQL